MYTLSKNLKLTAIVLMAIGLIGLVVGFISTPGSIEEVKQELASHHDGHGESHEPAGHGEHGGHDAHASEGHDAHGGDAHYEHVLHQLQNKPWAALYVAAFFFLSLIHI